MVGPLRVWRDGVIARAGIDWTMKKQQHGLKEPVLPLNQDIRPVTKRLRGEIVGRGLGAATTGARQAAKAEQGHRAGSGNDIVGADERGTGDVVIGVGG